MRASKLYKKRFGFLTVWDRGGYRYSRAGKKKDVLWVCQCDCGAAVTVRGDHLRSGRVKACAVNGHRWRPKNAPLHP